MYMYKHACLIHKGAFCVDIFKINIYIVIKLKNYREFNGVQWYTVYGIWD